MLRRSVPSHCKRPLRSSIRAFKLALTPAIYADSSPVTCAPQKVDPALIARVRPTIVGCFWPVFFFAGHNSHRKRGETDRPRLRSTAPALDPSGHSRVLAQDGVNSYGAPTRT